jgi:glycosyltransferase involved in cell wall biosynthesis
MTADFSYLPNVDATRWLTTEIFPRLLTRRPRATLQLVGMHAPSGLLPEGVTASANVPRIQPYFDDADVFVVPLRAGGGTRLKIIEALAKGLPTVSTTIGCEGLAVRDGEHLLVADTAEDMVKATVRLLDDRELRRKVANNGRALAKELYGWDNITDLYAADLRRMAAGGIA